MVSRYRRGGTTMWRTLVPILALAPALLIAACAHERPQPVPKPPPPCNYRALPLRVGEGPDGGPASSRLPTPTLGEELAPAFLGPGPAGLGTVRAREIAVLSGGSQHGAFGAGLFLGLPSVPTYDVVTGVSTGSLQSTIVFLANQLVPGDRVYPADQGER